MTLALVPFHKMEKNKERKKHKLKCLLKVKPNYRREVCKTSYATYQRLCFHIIVFSIVSLKVEYRRFSLKHNLKFAESELSLENINGLRNYNVLSLKNV